MKSEEQPVWYQEYTGADWSSDLSLDLAAFGRATYIKVKDVTGGSNLVVKMNGGRDTTLVVDDEEELRGRFDGVDATTNVTRIRVGWSDR